jgi:hypothetical protein
MKSNHQAHGLIKCDHCHFYSKDRSKVNFHIKKIHDICYKKEKVSENVTAGFKPVTEDLTALTEDVTDVTEDMFTENVTNDVTENVTAMPNNVAPVTKSNSSHEKPFECKYCPFKTGLLENLQRHHGTIHLACDPCDIVFKTYNEILLHWSHVHTTKKLSVCERSDYKTVRKSGFQSHLKTKHLKSDKDMIQNSSHVHNRRVFACKMCDFKTKQMARLKHHKKNFHNKTQCKFCGCQFKSTRSQKWILLHQLDIHFACDPCDIVFKTDNEMFHHWTNVHSKKVYVCESCDYKTIVGKKFERHKRTYSHQANALIKCDIVHCHFYSKDRSKINNHITKKHKKTRQHLSVSGNDIFGLLKLDISAENVTPVTENVTAVTPVTKSNRNENLFECDICGIKTNFLKTLSQHITVVHLKMPVNDSDKFKCDRCDFKSVWKYVIYQHVQSAHKKVTQQQYQCENCDYATYSEDSLDHHVQFQKCKQFQCDICDISILSPYKMLEHLKNEHI